jgi:broad specificity phosphatase PhoE
MTRPPIYFLRHGETAWNAAGKLQGRLDIPLNAKGMQQARRNGGVLAELLDDPHVPAYVASPLTRTRQTMEIARQAVGLPDDGFATDDRLLEINFGRWEGLTWSEIKRNDDAELKARNADEFGYTVPGGESYEMVMARVVSWLGSVTSPTVVVSHGGIMRCLRGHVLGLPNDAILKLDIPQDKVMLIEGGSVRLI